MARKKLLHLKSGVVNSNGTPKLPTSEQIELGEIAVNYAKGHETLAIKNSSGDVVSFSNDKILIDYVDSKTSPKQTTGDSTTDVMSQAAVTRELGQKLAISDFNTYSGNVNTTINGKVDKVSGKGLSTNDYTTAEKNKLSGIASGAQVNVIESVKVNGTALTITNKAVDVTVPTKTSQITNDSNFAVDASYVHTDNNYTTTEKNKLSGIASGAEVNQNAFSNIKVGSTTIAADSKTDTLEISGSGIVTITANATNDKITISASNAVTSVAGKTGAVTLGKSDVGLGNVDNTADANKTVKAATSAATADTAKAVALSGVTNAEDLKAIEALTGTSGLLKKTAANTWTLDTNSYSTTAVAVTGATYNSTDKAIELKNAAGTVVSTVDATAFIKDGMVSNVEVKNIASSGTCLVITFNTDAGKDAINIPISQIFDANNYYTKADLTGSSTTVVVAKASSATTAASAGSVALSNVSGADDLKKIEALTGTSGLLKKTAANTWTLDTTSYSSATQVNTALASKAGTGITITAASGLTGGGNLSANRTIGLAATGTSGTYGPTADVTGTEGTTIKIPQITTDAYGRVTAVTERTLTNKNSTYTVNNGTFTISGNGVSVASTSANASANTGINIKAGSNVTITTGTSEVTIAAKDTTYGVVSTSANGLAPKVTDTSKFLKGDGTWATPTDTNNRRSFYGTCDTAAATAEKAVTLSDTSGWELKAGTIVGIKFTNTNSASNVTLNVNSSGAKSIWYNNAAYTGTSNSICGYANRATYYMYDGTHWVWLNTGVLDGNTDTKVAQTVTTTSADYEVLFSNTADNTTRTEGARKNSNLKFNPSTGNLQTTQLNGVTIGSSPKFTDNDTKVTSVGNHYAPSATSADTKSATASSTSELNWGSAVVTGVTLSGDAKGHITSVTVASGKLKTPVTGVTLASGTNNGTVKLTVNGSATDNIAVKGLSSMAYQATSSYSSATQVNTALSNKVDKVTGKGLSTNDYTTDEKNKLSGIASGAQVNVIEAVKVNGTALTVTSKAVDVTVPTKTSDLTNDSNFVSDASYVHTDNNYTTTEKDKLAGIAAGAEVNVQSDWNATSGDAFIKNKPTIPDSFQWFGTSSTAAATVEKEVSIPSITSLKTGQIIVVKPTVTSTVASSTLKLNSFDAYPMRYNNAAITTSTDSIVWAANIPSLFVFDGTYWEFLGHGLDSNTTYSAMSVAEGTAGTATSGRVMRADYLKQIIQTLAPQSDWDATSGNAVILNKPTIPAAASNGTYTVKTLVGTTTTNVSDFTANQSTADDVTFVQGSNVTITPDATNRKITIAAKDTTYSTATTAATGLMSAEDKTKLNGIAAGAEVNVQSDWNATSGDAQILNKPTLGAAAAKGVSSTIANSTSLIEAKPVFSGVGATIEYVSADKKIYLKSKSGNTLASVDTTDFIKDGMVNNVEISGNSLVITFNTDSGKDPISIPLTDIFNPNNYYTKSELTGSSTTVVVAKASSATTAASASSVAWGNVSGKPSTFTPSAHNQASSTINSMSGYSKPSTTSAIASGDTLNAAIGKLEKALDGKQASGSYLTSHQTVTLASGTNNGTLKITTAAGTTDNVAVKGINSMAYQPTSSYSSATQVNTALSGKSNTGHTHNYAGSSTAGGAATSAAKLTNTSAIGSATKPVFFTANGVPSACTYTLGTSVPSDAKFTDNNTTYAAGSFVTITGTNNTINVSTGTTSATVARGDHSHSNYLTGITSSQVTTALGYTPYNSSNPQGYTSNLGTVTSIIAGNGLSGGTITSSGTIGLQTIGTAGTYSQVVVDSYGRVTSGNTSGGAPEANYFIIGSTEGSGNMPEFDAYTDTLHVTPQVLTSAQKEQARTNIDAENKVDIIVSNGQSLSAEVNKYYRYDSAIETLSVTLPTPSDTSHLSSIIISLTTSSASPSITFASSATIKYQDGWAIDADSTYEINAVYNGSYWALAAIKLA